MNWLSPKTHFVEKPAVDPALVQKCLAMDVDGFPIFDAVLTVIESHRRTWHDGAAGVISDHAKLAGFVQADFALKELANGLRKLRAAGQKND